MTTSPTFTWELSLLENTQYEFIIGFDEVGRGAIAGPVVVAGVLLKSEQLKGEIPEGLKDSKLISEKKRPIILEAVKTLFPIHALAESSAQQVDSEGIIASLASAAKRSLDAILSMYPQNATDTRPNPSNTLLLLDGSHNWLTDALPEWDSMTKVKGDRDCVSMAAASLIAKVHRDELMIRLSNEEKYAGYAWDKNKGYGAKIHYEGIEIYGVSDMHRASWIKKR